MFAWKTHSAAAVGAAGQFASASVTSIRLPIRLDGGKRRGPGRRPWFYLRLGSRAGLTLLRVLRGGLGLGEYLGRLRAGRTKCLRLPLAPVVRDPGARGEGTVPHQPGPPGPLRLAASTASDRSVRLASKAAG